MSVAVDDVKINALKTALSLTTGSIQDLEWQFYSTNSGLIPIYRYSISDHKKHYWRTQAGLSLPISIRDAELGFYAARGAVGKGMNLEYDFYNRVGFTPPVPPDPTTPANVVVATAFNAPGTFYANQTWTITLTTRMYLKGVHLVANRQGTYGLKVDSSAVVNVVSAAPGSAMNFQFPTTQVLEPGVHTFVFSAIAIVTYGAQSEFYRSATGGIANPFIGSGYSFTQQEWQGRAGDNVPVSYDILV